MTSSPKTRKRPGPAPTGKGTLIGVRLQREDLKAVDAWRQLEDVTLPEAIRRLVRLGLTVPRRGKKRPSSALRVGMRVGTDR